MESNPTVFAKLLRFVSVIEFITVIIINPLVGKYWRDTPIENYADVMQLYFYFGISISVITFVMSIIIDKTKSERIRSVTLLFFVLSLIILSDRLLLAKFGFSLWEYDQELIYKQRPNIVRSWGPEFNNKLIKINSLGFHDDEISLNKSSDEIRIFMLGNSITMGHGITKEETFSNQLEKILNKSYTSRSFEVINMGVQGYSTFQELGMLKRYFYLKPDLIIVEFCLNDVIEPFYTIKKFGGSNFDYHEVDQSESFFKNYFFNTTGYGKLINFIKFHNAIKNAKMIELSQIYKLCEDSVVNDISDRWLLILSYLNKIYSISKKHNIPCVLLIYPYTLQFFHDNLTTPQKILIKNANKFNVQYIDFLKIFENSIIATSKLEKINIKQANDRFIKNFYLDEDHFSSNGHKLVANILFRKINDDSLLVP